jgi:hypothetical protein
MIKNSTAKLNKTPTKKLEKRQTGERVQFFCWRFI